MIRLVIADDHPLIRAGFRNLAAQDPAIRVVGEAADGHALLELLSETQADVVALDISMPGPGFEELVRRIRDQCPGTHVLVVSMYPEGELAIATYRAGASGYVSKSAAGADLLSAVRKVAEGGVYVTPSLAERLAAGLASGSLPGDRGLSPREREVLGLLGRGLTYKEVADAIAVSPKTIGTYRNRILNKLGLRTTADLVRYVVEHGLST